MSEPAIYWVVGRLRLWGAFQVHDTVDGRVPVRLVDDAAIGALLVYRTREEAEEAAPGAPVFQVEVGDAR